MAVPNTTTFSFWDVSDELYGVHDAGKNLKSAFTDSISSLFDPLYGSKTMSPKTLYGFRNYGGLYPGVSTDYIDNIVYNAADAHGTIWSTGGSAIIERGFVRSLTINPTTSDLKTVIGGTGTGAFSGQIFPHTLNTWYYVRAYATNSNGTGYGENVMFLSGPNYSGVSGSFGITCPVPTPYSNTIAATIGGAGFTFGWNYMGEPRKWLVITGFVADGDGDGATAVLKHNGTEVTSFPYFIDVTGLADGSLVGITATYSETVPNICVLPFVSESCSILFYIEDVDERKGVITATSVAWRPG